MIDIVVLVAIVVWFTWKSNQLSENPLQWGLLAAAGYLIPSYAVHSALASLLQDFAQHPDRIYFVLAFVQIASIMAGITVCFFVRKALLAKQSVNAPESENPTSSNE